MAVLWVNLKKSGWTGYRKKASRIHMLYALTFLRRYNTEDVNVSVFGVDEKTFRNWCWFFIEGLANLDKKIVSICFNILVFTYHLTFYLYV